MSTRTLYDVDVDVATVGDDDTQRRIVIRAAFWELVRPLTFGPELADPEGAAKGAAQAIEASFGNPTPAQLREAQRYMAGMLGRLLAGLIAADSTDDRDPPHVAFSVSPAEFLDLAAQSPLLVAVNCTADDQQHWLDRIGELIQRILVADEE